MWRARHLQRGVKNGWGWAHFRKFKIRVWLFWDLRSKKEAASGVKLEERDFSWQGWRLRKVKALSARKASDEEDDREERER